MKPAHAVLGFQYQSMEQQGQTAALGMWVFLASEVMFFGSLFTVYIIYRTVYPQAFGEGATHMSVPLGTTNTLLLIASSFTVATTVHLARKAGGRAPLIPLLLTMALAVAFLGIKAWEWVYHYQEHLYPGAGFEYPAGMERGGEIYFSLYYVMTGVHALHMVVGLGIFSVLCVAVWKRRYSPEYHTPLEVAGLYWHFVDIIWIFLFPLFYLVHPT